MACWASAGCAGIPTHSDQQQPGQCWRTARIAVLLSNAGGFSPARRASAHAPASLHVRCQPQRDGNRRGKHRRRSRPARGQSVLFRRRSRKRCDDLAASRRAGGRSTPAGGRPPESQGPPSSPVTRPPASWTSSAPARDVPRLQPLLPEAVHPSRRPPSTGRSPPSRAGGPPAPRPTNAREQADHLVERVVHVVGESGDQQRVDQRRRSTTPAAARRSARRRRRVRR